MKKKLTHKIKPTVIICTIIFSLLVLRLPAIAQETDCNGELGGTAYTDDCGECVGGNTGLTACADVEAR